MRGASNGTGVGRGRRRRRREGGVGWGGSAHHPAITMDPSPLEEMIGIIGKAATGHRIAEGTTLAQS